MADRSILYTIRAFLQGGYVAVAREVRLLSTYVGLLSGVADTETALQRIDGTGLGARIFRFTGSYSAQSSNIDEWFGDRQLNRMRCVADGNISPVNFDLPGTLALNAAFDRLVANGMEEILQFVLEYTEEDTPFMRVRPRMAADGPQILGATSVVVRTGTAANLEITRTNGVISSYMFTDIGLIGGDGSGAADSFRFTNPSVAVWDASATGTLPSTGVDKGSAYLVVNAPADGTGRFGEVMQNGDWVFWQGESFTSWSAEPHAWGVLPAHEVRRISALAGNFLSTFLVSPVSDRNTVIRNNSPYADTAGKIQLKIYPTVSDYDAADLNTTGNVDEYTNASDITGYLAIRLTGTQASLAGVIPTLYVYSENAGTFTRLSNMSRDFHAQGDFGLESDYLSNEAINYVVGDTLRIYAGQIVNRYHSPDLDVSRENLTNELQGEIAGQEPWASLAAVLFSGGTVSDIHALDRVEYAPGYSDGVDWRDMAQNTALNVNRYLDPNLTITVNNASFEIYGFGNTIQKLVALRMQRNDAQTGDGALMEMGSGQAFIRVNGSNEIQVNTTVGAGTASWASITDGHGSLTLGAGDNFILFEMVPIGADPASGEWELIADFFDGTSYYQANNIRFTPTGSANGDHLGFSRSVSQRGQVTTFKAINSPGYLTHSRLDSYVRQHRDDKWVMGFARLFTGSTDRKVLLPHLGAPSNVPVITSGTSVPSSIPGKVGDIFIDTAGKAVYIAAGNSSSGDWVQV